MPLNATHCHALFYKEMSGLFPNYQILSTKSCSSVLQTFNILKLSAQFLYTRNLERRAEFLLQNGEYLMAAAIFDILKQKFGSSLQVSSIQKLGRELQNIEGLKNRRTRFGTEYLVFRK